MKLNELAELILAVLHDLANSKGHDVYSPLEGIGAQLGEMDEAKVRQAGSWLKDQGLADVLFTMHDCSARITAAGDMLVEDGGRTGAIERYKAAASAATPFPIYPGPSLTRDVVVSHLLYCKTQGLCQAVYQGSTTTELVVVTDGNRKILIRGEPQGYVVIAEHLGSQTMTGRAETFDELVHLMTEAGKCYGGQWSAPITSARLSADTPATNRATISSLIGGAEIQAVFDPYLDNRALTSLLDILSFGGSLANNVRLLSSVDMTQGSIPRLTKTVAEDWFKQRGITSGEVRLMPKGEHRRFMLLGGGQSLILGMSLNSIAKNEAVRLEPDAEDRAFFDNVWATATPVF